MMNAITQNLNVARWGDLRVVFAAFETRENTNDSTDNEVASATTK